jgi:hypothetical protein
MHAHVYAPSRDHPSVIDAFASASITATAASPRRKGLRRGNGAICSCHA